MKKNSIIDYCGYILLSLFGPLVRCFPVEFALFLGRRLGDVFYTFDLRHKARAYANIKTALGQKASARELTRVTKEFYRAYGQNIMEIFFIPSFTREFLNKYAVINGKHYIGEAFKKGKGVIFLAVHEGSWELSSIICANLGFPFVFFARGQDYPRLNRLLNAHRSLRGCRVIEKQNDMRSLLQVLKSNQAVGMTVDQGGKAGTIVKFFGKEASMSSGAVRLALKYDTAIIPAFYKRVEGPKIEVTLGPPFELKKTGNLQEDIIANLQEIIRIFERYLEACPKEYLWTYKIWKYGRQRSVLVLDDAKAGHTGQSQALLGIVGDYLKERGIKIKVDTVKVEFKSKLARNMLTCSSGLSGKYHCQGCLWCLRKFLKEGVYKSLAGLKPDLVISCGSALAPVNYILSRENQANSLVIMRPSILSTKRFDLVVMPKHDKPAARDNIVAIEGALNLIDTDYLKEKSQGLINAAGHKLDAAGFYIGLLIGGDTKEFFLDKNVLAEVIRQVKAAAEDSGAGVLVSTSRRTSGEIENLLKQEFADYRHCKLLIIANENNLPGVAGGILGLSSAVVISPETISMVSEGISAGRYIITFESGIAGRHRYFLERIAQKGYIYISPASGVSGLLKRLIKEKPPINALDSKTRIKEALGRLVF